RAPAATAEEDRARHEFERKPDLRRAGRRRQQRPLLLHLLSSAVRVQTARRCTVPTAGAALEPVIAHYRGAVQRLYFRGDAAFAKPEIYEFLEAERIGIRSGCQAINSCRAESAIR